MIDVDAATPLALTTIGRVEPAREAKMWCGAIENRAIALFEATGPAARVDAAIALAPAGTRWLKRGLGSLGTTALVAIGATIEVPAKVDTALRASRATTAGRSSRTRP